MRVKNSIHEKQKNLFPGLAADQPYDTTTTVKRHYLRFPFFPFRTLNTRELAALGPISEFDSYSPLFPAHTQINLNFKRRKVDTLLNFMLPYNLNYKKGSSTNKLTATERSSALTFRVPDAAAFKDYSIKGIEVKISDMYLQV